VRNCIEYIKDKFLVCIRSDEVNYVAEFDKVTGKQLSTIPNPSGLNSIQFMATVPGFNIHTFPYAVIRDKESISVIDV
jgi:hypothetical protein